MKLFRLPVLILPLFLAACGLSAQQQADYDSVQRSGVSSAVYDKMIHGDPLSLYDIKALTRARVNDGVILRYMRDQRTIYVLNSTDVQNLRSAGVSQSIVDYMLQTQTTVPATSPDINIGIGVYPAPYYGPYGPYYGPGPYWGPGPYYGGYHRWH